MDEPAEHPPGDFFAINGLDDFPAALKDGIVAIGNFDGVHRGHQAVLGEALATGAELGRPVYAMTFEPHPRTVFRPDHPVFRLTPAAIKATLMNGLGLNGMLVLPFDREFAGQSAEDFVSSILIDQLAIRHAVTGYDFHFGKNRQGSPRYLHEAGLQNGFGVSIVGAFSDEGGDPVSSTRIRDSLEIGDVAAAAGLLGYSWLVQGEVIDGEKRGRDLGFPTANIRLPDNCQLRFGIYAVRIVVDGKAHSGVANFGSRPTFDDGAALLEVFIFDFSADIYGKTATVAFLSFLRPEEKFESIDALIRQMDLDCQEARNVCASIGGGNILDQAISKRVTSG